MVYLILKDETVQAKLMLEYLKTMPFVSVVEADELPNIKTLMAIKEANTSNLKKHNTIKSIMDDLNS